MGTIFFMILSIIFFVLLVVSGAYIYTLRQKLDGLSLEKFARLQAKNKDLTQHLDEMKQDYNELRNLATPLMYMEKDIKTKIPSFTTGTNQDKLDRLYTFWTESFGGENVLLKHSPGSEQFFCDLRDDLEDTKLIELLQKRVTEPFFDKLSHANLDPIEVREMVVKMAMLLFDAVSYSSANRRSIDQGLNRSVVLREENVTEEEALSKAYEKAKVITDLEVETPLWVRNLGNGLKELGLENKKLVLSGYKFSPQRNNTMEPTQEKTDLVE